MPTLSVGQVILANKLVRLELQIMDALIMGVSQP
jgi:hypothetical protein